MVQMVLAYLRNGKQVLVPSVPSPTLLCMPIHVKHKNVKWKRQGLVIIDNVHNILVVEVVPARPEVADECNVPCFENLGHTTKYQ